MENDNQRLLPPQIKPAGLLFGLSVNFPGVFYSGGGPLFGVLLIWVRGFFEIRHPGAPEQPGVPPRALECLKVPQSATERHGVL